jgi:hypothetical protein
MRRHFDNADIGRSADGGHVLMKLHLTRNWSAQDSRPRSRRGPSQPMFANEQIEDTTKRFALMSRSASAIQSPVAGRDLRTVFARLVI